MNTNFEVMRKKIQDNPEWLDDVKFILQIGEDTISMNIECSLGNQ